MGTGSFSDAFKRDAAAQITERGYSVAEVSKRLGGGDLPLNFHPAAIGASAACAPRRGVGNRRTGCGEDLGEGRRGLVAARGMRPRGVITLSPFGNGTAGVIEAKDQALVHQLVAHPPVEGYPRQNIFFGD